MSDPTSGSTASSMSRLTRLKQELSGLRNLEECLLLDVAWKNFGLGLDLTFDYVWATDGSLRADVDDRRVPVVLSMSGVRSLVVANTLTEFMWNHTQSINWSVTEIAQVRAVPEGDATFTSSGEPDLLTLQVLGEGDRRRLEATCSSIEIDRAGENRPI